MKKTKIICSIGPVSRNYEIMKKMIQCGMNVARINFSHASDIEKKETKELVHQINKELNTNVAILYDTKGPDFRTGEVVDNKIELIEGKTIRIVKEDIIGTEESITVNYKNAIDSISIGNDILLEDGLMKLVVTDKDLEGLTCQIINGAILGSKKGINIPGVKLNLPFISKQDKEDIIYACNNDGDFLALSFVTCKEEVIAVREILKNNNSHMQIISKIESSTAIENLDEIIEYSDGIMVARGDLGVEVPMHELPILQKLMIRKCREQGKFCIVATEMLSSMQKSSRPTRAEVSDIANAVLDGTDAVMLSGETTAGKYPVESVKYMADICLNTEDHIDPKFHFKMKYAQNITSAIASSVYNVANLLDVKLIVAATISGYTAKVISNIRPKCLILATCPDKKAALGLALNWGVYPTIVNILETTEEIIIKAKEKAKEFIDLKEKDIVIITGGFVMQNSTNQKVTNFLKIEEV